MKTKINPTVFIVVKTYPNEARENLGIFLNEKSARQFATNKIGNGFYIHLETCVINGEFIAHDDGSLKEY